MDFFFFFLYFQIFSDMLSDFVSNHSGRSDLYCIKGNFL